MITKDLFNSLPDFKTYFEFIQELYSNNKTTGENQSEKFLNYTKLGIARTKRGLKTLVPSQEIIDIASSSNYKNWLVITEAWCGDAGHILPFIENIASKAEGVTLKIMLRDEHPEIMDQFLTNGGRSIPIFVAIDENFKYKSHWGPRPGPAQEIAMNHKKKPTKSYEEYQIELQKWYLEDKAKTLQKELLEYLSL